MCLCQLLLKQATCFAGTSPNKAQPPTANDFNEFSVDDLKRIFTKYGISFRV